MLHYHVALSHILPLSNICSFLQFECCTCFDYFAVNCAALICWLFDDKNYWTQQNFGDSFWFQLLKMEIIAFPNFFYLKNCYFFHHECSLAHQMIIITHDWKKKSPASAIFLAIFFSKMAICWQWKFILDLGNRSIWQKQSQQQSLSLQSFSSADGVCNKILLLLS